MRSQLLAIVYIFVKSGRLEDAANFLKAYLAAPDNPDDADDLKKLTEALKTSNAALFASTAAAQP